MTKLLVASAAAFLALAAPASAHVSVQPAEAARGSDVELTFRVPNERDDAATVEVDIQLPDDVELHDVPEVTGWTSETDDDTVRWHGGRVEPGQSFEVRLSVGTPPDAERLVFKAVQTYDSGEVVRWIDEDHAADHPAPVLTLTGDPAAGTTATPDDDDREADVTDEEEAIPVSDDDDLPVGGIVAAVALVVLVVAAYAAYAAARRRRHERASG